MMKILKNVLPKSAIIFLIFTVICGVVYTGIVTGIAQLIFLTKPTEAVNVLKVNLMLDGIL